MKKIGFLCLSVLFFMQSSMIYANHHNENLVLASKPVRHHVRHHRTAGIVTVERVNKVLSGRKFICDLNIKQPIFGRNMEIRIRGVKVPYLHSGPQYLRHRAREVRNFVERKLHNADNIRLVNMRRVDNAFAIEADVFVDNVSLAELVRTFQFERRQRNRHPHNPPYHPHR